MSITIRRGEVAAFASNPPHTLMAASIAKGILPRSLVSTLHFRSPELILPSALIFGVAGSPIFHDRFYDPSPETCRTPNGPRAVMGRILTAVLLTTFLPVVRKSQSDAVKWTSLV